MGATFSLLSPGDAANIAELIYTVQEGESLSEGLNSRILNNFAVPDGTRFEGVSGGVFLNAKTGFGMVLKGRQGGEFEGDALIAMRGTATLHDGITDAHAGTLYPSASGKMVHSGFNKTFLTFKNELDTFFSQFAPRRVHCVGHSLGGALATLAAEWCSANNIGQPVLYTFGCPRVGSADFAKYLTDKLGDNNIYRVYHKSDPVSMVPIWPFAHVPLPGTDCYIETTSNFSPAMHKMEYYGKSVSGSSWDILKRNKPEATNDKLIEAWLNIRSPISMTYFNVLMIQEAVKYILKKILLLLGIGLQGLLVTGVSNFLDMLAYVLDKAAKMSIEIAEFVQNLIRRILSAVGIAIEVGKNLTVAFIRWVLLKFTEAIILMVRTALHVANRR
ncbi:MAG: lipase family protein [Gammaproteobacteria bacterium]|nr:lipase family protein [Gammaproteobacteria bacterium]